MVPSDARGPLTLGFLSWCFGARFSFPPQVITSCTGCCCCLTHPARAVVNTVFILVFLCSSVCCQSRDAVQQLRQQWAVVVTAEKAVCFVQAAGRTTVGCTSLGKPVYQSKALQRLTASRPAGLQTPPRAPSNLVQPLP